LLADAGYFSEANVESCQEETILPFISAHRDKHNPNLKERFSASSAESVGRGW
jgi:hypothetical protein